MDFIKDHKVLLSGIAITGFLYKYKVVPIFFTKLEKNISMESVNKLEKESKKSHYLTKNLNT